MITDMGQGKVHKRGGYVDEFRHSVYLKFQHCGYKYELELSFVH